MAHQPNIFRKVRDARQDVISRLNDEVYSDQYELEKSRLDALDELLRYIKSLSYIKHKDTKKRLEEYFKSGLNCRTTAARLGIDNINAVEQTVKNASDKVRRIIEQPLDNAMQAKTVDAINEAVQMFRVKTDQPDAYGYFLPGLSRFLPSPKYNPIYKLRDCEKELTWLGVFAHFAEFLLTQFCNPEKIAHILSLISSRNGSALDREALKLFFSGKFSQNETGKQRTIQQQVSHMLEWLEQQNPYMNEEDEVNAPDAD